MRYVLGIDQGASKTHVCIADERGTIIGLVREEGLCNSEMVPQLELMERSVRKLLRQTGIRVDQISTVVAGLNGVDWADDGPAMETALRERLGVGDVLAVNDCIVALRAETDSEYAAVICVGSGANCAVRKGQELFTYGFYIPDEHQGGMALGKWAVQSVFDAEVGLIPPTKLRDAILKKLGEPTVDHLLRRRSEGNLTVKDYLSLPVTLEEVALEGDPVALSIWTEYGKILANYITVRMGKMDMKDEPIQVVLSGSIFKCRVEQFQATVERDILSYAPNAVIIPAVYEPIMGAIRMGLERLHGDLPKDVDAALRRSSQSFGIMRFEKHPGDRGVDKTNH